MRLHLPKGLRAALLACLGLLSPVSTTVSVAAFAAGFATYSLQQAGATTINTSDDENLVNATEGETVEMDLASGSLDADTGNIQTVAASLQITQMKVTSAASSQTYNFNGALTGSGPITLDVSDNNQTWNFNGDISGYTGAITITGNNVLAFTGNSEINASAVTVTGLLKISGTHTINSTITAATLEMGAGTNTLGNNVTANVLNVVSGGTVYYNNTNKTDTELKVTSGTAVLGTGVTMQVNTTDSLGYSNQAEVVLEAGSTLNFNGKRWTVGSNNNIILRGGSITGTGDGNGCLDFYTNAGTNPGLSAESGDSVISAGIRFRNSGQIQTLSVSDGATLTISGTVFGPGGFKKIGAGMLTISSQTTYTGGTTIEAGRIRLINQGRLGTGQVSIGANGTLIVEGGSIVSEISNKGSVIFGAGASVDLSADLFDPTARDKALGNGYGGIIAQLDDIITGTGSVTVADDVTWSCGSCALSYSDGQLVGRELSGDYYYIYTTPTQDDLNELPNANHVVIGENFGEAKLAGSIKAGAEVIVESGSTWDINGNANKVYTVVLNGGTLTNTGGAVTVDSMQINKLVLTDNSTVSGTASHGLVSSGWGASTLDLGEKILTKTGGNTFICANTTIAGGGILRIEEGAINCADLAGKSKPNCILGSTADEVATNICLAGGTLTGALTLGRDAEFYTDGTDGVAGSVSAALVLGNHTLTLRASDTADTLTLSGAITGSGRIVVDGSGSVTLSGSSVAVGEAILNKGNLILGDATALSMSATDASNLVGYKDKGVAALNGYIEAGKLWIIQNADAATITGGGSITEIEVGGETKTLTKDNSGWYFAGDVAEDPGAYYVNSGVVLYQGDTTDGQGGIADATTLKLNGGTLKMTTALTDQVTGGIRVIKTSVVDLSGEDVVLKKSKLTIDTDVALVLQGNGIYDIGSDITTGVTLASGENGWTGTVAVSDTALGGPVAWDNYVNGTFSTLQLTSVQGWISQNSTVAANLRLLEGTDGAAGFTITGVNTGASYSFTGKISGDGNLAMKQSNGEGRSATFNLQGDCSEWTGNFLLSNIGNGTATVNYTGSAVIGNGFVNASAATMNVLINKNDEAVTLQGAITKEGSGALNITLSGSSVKTLQKAVTASSLTVNDGAATLEDTLTVDTLTANTDTTLKGTDNVIGTLGGSGKLFSTVSTEITNALSQAVAIEVQSGSLLLSGGMADGCGSVKVYDGATLELRGNTSSGSGTVTLESGAQLSVSGSVELAGKVDGSGALLVNQDSSLTVKGNVTLGETIVNNGALSVEEGGSISFDSVLGLESIDLAFKDPIDTGSVNGYATGAFTVVKVTDPNDNTSTSLTKVILEGTEYGVSVNDDNSAYIVTKQPDSGLYYICSGTVNYGEKDDEGNPLNAAALDSTKGLVLNGGNLHMLTSLNKKAVDEGIKVQKDATISVADGVAVDNIALTVNDGVKLTLDSGGDSLKLDAISGTGTVSSDKDLLVDKGGDFTGSYDGNVRIGTAADEALQKLRADSKLTVIGTAGTVEVTGLNNTAAANNVLGGLDTTGASVKLDNKTDDGAPTKVTLGSASSMDGGVLEFTVSAKDVNSNLAADKTDKPTVITGERLDLSNVTLKVNEVDNMGFAYNTDGPEKDILLFVVSDNAASTVDAVKLDMSGCSWMSKYFTNFRVEQGSINVVADANTNRYAAYGQTPNGTAGLALAGKAMFRLDPQTRTPGSELAQVLDMLDNHIASGNTGAMDRLGAALAGSSLSAVGLAVADDVQRQLRSIRNRTTTMGVNECVVNEDMPYVNGWISGDGNYRQLSESGTDASYQVSSWGGTVGVDVDVNPNLTLGVAVSALFGDYTGKAADTLTGNLDTQYVSLFARVSTGSWVNTFVGTLGRADVDLERTIPGVTGKTTYKTNGMMFGFLYEVARTFALNEDASTCVQPLFNMSFSHTSLDSATEGGTADTRLTTDSASLTQFSLGLGGRLQSVVGENEYNRASIFEARALLKLDLGDRYNKLNTALAALPTATVTTRSNEKGVIGAELGATLTIPLSQDAGSIFFDVNADFNADQTGVNGSVGYRVNF